MFSQTVENVVNHQKKKIDRYNLLKKKHLNLVKNKIEYYAKLDIIHCIYKIPPFILGEIVYDINDISTYLINQLSKEGFKVILLNTHLIYISWNIKDLGN